MSNEQRRLLAGLLTTVTLHATHGLAGGVVLPLLVADLGGRALYGLFFSTYLLASIAGMGMGGRIVDRRGAGASFAVGLVAFGIGITVTGLAPSMPAVLVGRLIEGFGGGIVSAVGYACIALGFSEAERPRILTWRSAAWIAPALIAPALAGFVAETTSWRWVFLGLLPLLALAAALSLPPARLLPRPQRAAPRGTPSGQRPRWRSDRVVGAILLTKGLLCLAFFGVDSFVPIALIEVHGTSATWAGIVLSIASLSWTAGSSLTSAWQLRFTPARLAAIGLGTLLSGIALWSGAFASGGSMAVAIAGWALAGLGIGIAYNTLDLAGLARAPDDQTGAVSSALGISDSVGFAIGAALGGALLARGAGQGPEIADSIAAIGATMGAATLLALGCSRVIRGRPPAPRPTLP